jgi:hypothetical protein
MLRTLWKVNRYRVGVDGWEPTGHREPGERSGAHSLKPGAGLGLSGAT